MLASDKRIFLITSNDKSSVKHTKQIFSSSFAAAIYAAVALVVFQTDATKETVKTAVTVIIEI